MKMYTGLTDRVGEKIYEGDYVQRIYDDEEECRGVLSAIGRVFWDTRRNSWQVVRPIVPSFKVNPADWGKAWAVWLNAFTAKNFVVGKCPFTGCKFTAKNVGAEDWVPKTFFSGGVEIKYTTYAESHKGEIQNDIYD